MYPVAAGNFNGHAPRSCAFVKLPAISQAVDACEADESLKPAAVMTKIGNLKIAAA